jgi:hypothetical protein
VQAQADLVTFAAAELSRGSGDQRIAHVVRHGLR